MTKPVLLLMKGSPGSGKSAVARALGRRLGWPVIDKDDIRDLLPDELGGLSYAAMLSLAGTQLGLGQHFSPREAGDPLVAISQDSRFRRASQTGNPAQGLERQLLRRAMPGAVY